MGRSRAGTRAGRALVALVAVLTAQLALPGVARAIPAFARKYEVSCRTCHDYHYPQLNAFGRLFQERGYQLPEGAEDAVRARRTIEPGAGSELLAIAKEPPLGARGQVFGLVPLWGQGSERPAYQNALFTYVYGGGAIAPDVSFFFSFSPYPALVLHHLHVGFHELGASLLGEGTLNVRAGSFFLLDAARPGHRLLDAGMNAFGNATVGLSQLALDAPALGVEAFGHPLRGPLGYQLAVVAGDTGSGNERDGWKDVFLRVSYTFFQNTAHELIAGAFGYRGRADLKTKLAGVDLVLANDVWFLGGDLEAALGPVTLFASGYAARHRDARPQLGAVIFWAARLEASWALTDELSLTARQERVASADLKGFDQSPLSVHLAWTLATNVVLSATWRHDFDDPKKRALVALVDVAF